MPRMTPPRRFPVILPVNRDVSPRRSSARPMTAASANSPRGNTHDASTAMRHTSTSLRHPSTSTGQGPTTGPRSATQIQGNAADVHTRAQQEFRRSRRPVHRTTTWAPQPCHLPSTRRGGSSPVRPARPGIPGHGRLAEHEPGPLGAPPSTSRRRELVPSSSAAVLDFSCGTSQGFRIKPTQPRGGAASAGTPMCRYRSRQTTTSRTLGRDAITANRLARLVHRRYGRGHRD